MRGWSKEKMDIILVTTTTLWSEKSVHEHFGHVTRANNRATPLSSRPGGTVSVDDFGAKADGRDDTQVNISYQQKGETFFPCEFNPFLMSINYLFF